VTALYPEPPPKTRRVTYRDDTALHQIRLGQTHVTCACRTRHNLAPLGPATTLAASLALYEAHVAAEGSP
jgi:hypothetical protein